MGAHATKRGHGSQAAATAQDAGVRRHLRRSRRLPRTSRRRSGSPSKRIVRIGRQATTIGSSGTRKRMLAVGQKGIDNARSRYEAGRHDAALIASHSHLDHRPCRLFADGLDARVATPQCLQLPTQERKISLEENARHASTPRAFVRLIACAHSARALWTGDLVPI